MGAFVNRRSIAILSWTAAVILILGLNTWLVFGALREWLA
jgi:type IV secretory pathway TrbD component